MWIIWVSNGFGYEGLTVRGINNQAEWEQYEDKMGTSKGDLG
jgi:hypothetical protein